MIRPLSFTLLLALLYTTKHIASGFMLRQSLALSRKLLASSRSACAMSTYTPDSIVTFTYDLGDGLGDKLNCPIGECTAVVPKAPFKTGSYFPAVFESLPSVGETVTVSDLQLASSNPDMIAEIKVAQLEASGLTASDLAVGQTLFLQNGMKAEIVSKSDDVITIDANPPLSRLNGATMTLTTIAASAFIKAPAATGTLSSWTSGVWSNPTYKSATFAGGCFWGVELAYQRVPGVVGTKVGYTQGRVHSPSYEAVCSGTTGHTEAVQVVFDESIVEYEELCELLVERLGDNVYKKNQVGNDCGTQYRSGIYPHDAAQRAVAEAVLEAIDGGSEKVMTEVVDAKDFFNGEDYHQQYLMKGGQSAKKEAKETIRCYG